MRELLAKENIDLLWIEDPVQLFYLTHLNMSAGKLLITKKASALFVDGRYYEMAKKKSPCPVYKEAELPQFLAKNRPDTIGFDPQTTTFSAYQRLQKITAGQLVPVDCRDLRVIKNPAEIKAMKQAAKLAWEGFTYAKSLLEPGMEEREVALAFEMYCRKKGAERLSFPPIVAFGKNSAFPHYRAGKEKLKKNSIVLIDFGVVLHNYCSDCTRTFFYGKANPELKKIYDLVKKAHDKALTLCKPGTKVGMIDQAVQDFFAKHKVQKYFVHSLGHGVGLQLHEFPRLRFDGEDKDLILKPGMVFTIEPGLYIPGVGGVRYEDTVVITATGYQNFYA